MAVRIVALGTALCVAAGSAAQACQVTGNAILDDQFRTPDPGWGRPDSITVFGPRGLALTPPPNGSAWRINQNYRIESDWCVEVTNPATLPAGGDPKTVGDVGLWFWGRDNQNFYTATISLAGAFAIDRLVNGRWEVVVRPTPSPAIKAAPGAANELELVVTGDAGAFFVNGVRVTDFHGQPPQNGGAPGIYGESGPTPTTWAFTRARLF